MPLSMPSAQLAWEATLKSLLEDGVAFGAKRPGVEILGFTVGIDDARARVGNHPARPLAIVPAVARFVWMMAGSDRLADIAFYEPKVASYTDDKISVPGSNYGARLRNAAPGLDQIKEAIDRLEPDAERPDNHLRRAVNVIWRPEDSARESNDIPCAFGVGYFPRDGRLHTELVMRSNNSMLLMPFNLFEFSLLAEVVAVGAGLEPGPLLLHAMSMHLYDAPHERGVAETIVEGGTGGKLAPMPPMPAEDNLAQIGALVRCEADLRHAGQAVATEPLNVLRERANGLNEYWRPFFEILLVHHLAVAARYDDGLELAGELPDWAAPTAQTHVEKMQPEAVEDTPSTLFDDVPQLASAEVEVDQVTGAPLSKVYEEYSRSAASERAHIHALIDEIELSNSLSFTDANSVVEELLRERPVFARDENQATSLDDVRGVLLRRGLL